MKNKIGSKLQNIAIKQHLPLYGSVFFTVTSITVVNINPNVMVNVERRNQSSYHQFLLSDVQLNISLWWHNWQHQSSLWNHDLNTIMWDLSLVFIPSALCIWIEYWWLIASSCQWNVCEHSIAFVINCDILDSSYVHLMFLNKLIWTEIHVM